MKVLGDRVIVRTEAPPATETASGVVLIDIERPRVVGEVIACADNPDLRVGDVVIFAPTAGQPLEWESEPCLVLAFDEIDAIYEEGTVL